VDDIPVSPRAGGLLEQGFDGGEVKIFFREKFREFLEVPIGEGDREIDIESEARFPVIDGSDGADDEIGQTGLVKRPNKKGEEINLGHGGVRRRSPGKFGSDSNRGVVVEERRHGRQ